MRRIGAVIVVLAAVAVALFGSGASSGSHKKTYLVRAIFDDAAFAVGGEDVRVAGAPVGSIQSLGVTSDQKAAVTLAITDSRFAPFHTDSSCAIRPQSLIGEKYVDCFPGTAAYPALPKITSGPGSGSYYLPLTHTSSPIDTDIVQNISQEPLRQRLSIILDELGTGLAARGSDLNAVIHRANPALGYTDQVIQILAKQNRQLAQLATDSDTVLAPLARVRSQIAGFITNANTTSVASATRAADIARSFQLLPGFLRQVRPLVADLGSFADQGTTLSLELQKGAAPLAKEFQALPAFANAARTSLIALGNSAQQSQPAVLASEPLAQQLLRLGNAALPSATSLDKLTSSFDNSGGIEQLMALLFYGTTTGNGFDSLGHYVRTEAITGGCNSYTIFFNPTIHSCDAHFDKAEAAPGDTFGVVPGGASAASAASAATAASARSEASATSTPTTSNPAGTAASVKDPAPPPIVTRAAATAGAKARPAGENLTSLLRYLTGSGR